MYRARVIALSIAPIALVALAGPAAASAKPPKPVVAISSQSSASVPARGGTVAFSGSVTGAGTCTLTSKPATTTVVTNCSRLPSFTAPLNPAGKPTTYKVTITATGSGSSSVSATVTQEAAVVVEVWGDSIAFQDGPFVQQDIEAVNPNVVTYIHAFPATNICFWDDPTRGDGIPKMLQAYKPSIVIIQLLGFGSASCAKGGDPNAWDYSPKGLAQVTKSYAAAIGEITKAKVGFTQVVTAPVGDGGPSQQVDDANMRQAIAAAVSGSGNASVHYLDPSPSLTGPDGLFTMTLPCTPDELATSGHCTGPVVNGVPSNYVRADDHFHLCNVPWTTPWPSMGCPGYSYSPGATRIASYIAAPIIAYLNG